MPQIRSIAAQYIAEAMIRALFDPVKAIRLNLPVFRSHWSGHLGRVANARRPVRPPHRQDPRPPRRRGGLRLLDLYRDEREPGEDARALLDLQLTNLRDDDVYDLGQERTFDVASGRGERAA